MINKLVIISVLFISFSVNSEIIFIDNKESDGKLFYKDIELIKKSETGLNNQWLYEQYGFLSGSGESMYLWLKDRIGHVAGGGFLPRGCAETIDDSDYKLPLCHSKNTEIKNPIDDVYKIRLPHNKMSIYFMGMLFEKKNISGGLVLDDGKAIQIDGNKSNLLVLNEMNNSSLSWVGDEAMSLYRFSHYMGLARLKELHEKGVVPYSVCKNLYNKEFYCEKYINGPLSLTGVLLRDFSTSCKKCKKEDRLFLYYVSLEYLSKANGNIYLSRATKKILDTYGNEMEILGLNTDKIRREIRWNSTQEKKLIYFK